MKRLAFAALACALMSGCAWRTQIERGIVSTGKIDFERSYEIDRTQKLSGSDRAHGIWLIPLGSPDADAAIANTLAKFNKTSSRKAVGIADTEVKFRFLWMYLYSQRWYTVEGHPIFEKK